MKRIATLLFALIFLTTQVSSSQVFASCAQVTVTEQKEMADIIALGTVTNTSSQNATVDVERYYKGNETPPELVVSGRQSSEGTTSVDLTFEEGKTYLLFLKKVVYTGGLLTDICSGTRIVTDGLTPEEQEALGSGQEAAPIPSSEVSVQSPPQNMVWIPMAVAAVAVLLSIPLILALKNRHKI